MTSTRFICPDDGWINANIIYRENLDGYDPPPHPTFNSISIPSTGYYRYYYGSSGEGNGECLHNFIYFFPVKKGDIFDYRVGREDNIYFYYNR